MAVDKDSRLAIPSTAWVEDYIEDYFEEALEAQDEDNVIINEDGDVVIDYDTSVWGIEASTIPYYDAEGAVLGEEATFSVNGSGDPLLTGP